MSQLVLWVLGFAGIILPQIPLGPLFENIAKLIPHYWANEAFYALLIRGQGLADISGTILVLLAFSVAFFTIGLWRFRFN
jgi:ABC-2 type transport system permease protein